MALPVAIYLAFNAGGPGAHGWGAAMSTDTAFALGVLALRGARRHAPARARCSRSRSFDDLVALLVIATVYTEHVVDRAAAGGRRRCSALLFALRFAPRAWRGPAAAVARRRRSGWRCYESGIDPVIAGLAVGPRDERVPAGRAPSSSA